MKRPAVVWIYSFFLAIGVLSAIIGVIASIAGIFIGEMRMAFIGYFFLNSVMLIIDGLFLYYFFMLKQKAKTWVHISFGVSLAITLISNAVEYIVSPAEASVSYIIIIAIPIMWWVVYDYIKKKKIDDQLLYSN
tara:strand:+ start:107 stop:508 length:402 start_codon:yes stop_codon:yes gene_type:complete